MKEKFLEQKRKNAEKQRRFRERQKEKGRREVRGYLTPEAQQCFDELQQITHWTDSKMLSNAVRLAYAAYKCGQVGLLSNYLIKHNK